MIARALLTIAVGVQLVFFADGNCTTELSEADEGNESSSRDYDSDVTHDDAESLGITEPPHSGAGDVRLDSFATLPDYEYSEMEKKRFNRGTKTDQEKVDSLRTGVINSQLLNSTEAEDNKIEKIGIFGFPNSEKNGIRFDRDSSEHVSAVDTNSSKGFEVTESSGTSIQVDAPSSVSDAENSTYDSNTAIKNDNNNESPVSGHPEPTLAESDKTNPSPVHVAITIRRFKRDTDDYDYESSSETATEVMASSATAGLLLDPTPSTVAPAKKKLKRFPSLQFIARQAVMEINGGSLREKPDQLRIIQDNIPRIYRRQVASARDWFRSLFH